MKHFVWIMIMIGFCYSAESQTSLRIFAGSHYTFSHLNVIEDNGIARHGNFSPYYGYSAGVGVNVGLIKDFSLSLDVLYSFKQLYYETRNPQNPSWKNYFSLIKSDLMIGYHIPYFTGDFKINICSGLGVGYNIETDYVFFKGNDLDLSFLGQIELRYGNFSIVPYADLSLFPYDIIEFNGIARLKENRLLHTYGVGLRYYIPLSRGSKSIAE